MDLCDRSVGAWLIEFSGLADLQLVIRKYLVAFDAVCFRYWPSLPGTMSVGSCGLSVMRQAA